MPSVVERWQGSGGWPFFVWGNVVLKQSVEIEIGGQKLAIRSEAGPQYVDALAHYVDATLSRLSKGRAGALNPHKAALLTAVQLADELLRERDRHEQFRLGVLARIDALETALHAHADKLPALNPHPATDSSSTP